MLSANRLAVAMSTHPRLGCDTLMKHLPSDVLVNIVDKVEFMENQSLIDSLYNAYHSLQGWQQDTIEIRAQVRDTLEMVVRRAYAVWKTDPTHCMWGALDALWDMLENWVDRFTCDLHPDHSTLDEYARIIDFGNAVHLPAIIVMLSSGKGYGADGGYKRGNTDIFDFPGNMHEWTLQMYPDIIKGPPVHIAGPWNVPIKGHRRQAHLRDWVTACHDDTWAQVGDEWDS